MRLLGALGVLSVALVAIAPGAEALCHPEWPHCPFFHPTTTVATGGVGATVGVEAPEGERGSLFVPAGEGGVVAFSVASLNLTEAKNATVSVWTNRTIDWRNGTELTLEVEPDGAPPLALFPFVLPNATTPGHFGIAVNLTVDGVTDSGGVAFTVTAAADGNGDDGDGDGDGGGQGAPAPGALVVAAVAAAAALVGASRARRR